MFQKSSCEILTLPPGLAKLAGRNTALAVIDENDMVDAYAAWAETPEGFVAGERLLCFSWADFGVIKDLFDRARRGTVQPDAQSMARIGAEPVKSKRRKKTKREDDRLRGKDGARIEEV